MDCHEACVAPSKIDPDLYLACSYDATALLMPQFIGDIKMDHAP
jgi:hypothetical protein